MKSKWVLPLILLVFVFFFGGGYLWMRYKLKEYKEDGELTTTLSPTILNKFQGNSISDYPFEEGSTHWEKEVLVLEDFPHESYSIRYIGFWNKELETSENIKKDKLKGLVLLKSEDFMLSSETVKEILESDKISSQDTAYRRFTSIQYFDLEKDRTVHRDTVWGKLPDKEAIQDGLGYGKYPRNKDVLKTLKTQLGIDEN